MEQKNSNELEEIFDDIVNPKIKESDSVGDYMITIVCNTGYNDNREHPFGDESLEEYARSKLNDTDKFSYVDIKLQHPDWLSDTVYIKLN